MAHGARKKDFIEEILRVLENEARATGHLIVTNTIISDLINLLSEDTLETYWSSRFQHIHVKSPLFGQWVRTVRKEAGLSQKEFAVKLTTPHLKLHQSDIGNLEKGRKLGNYRERRLENLRVAILQFKAEQEKS